MERAPDAVQGFYLFRFGQGWEAADAAEHGRTSEAEGAETADAVWCDSAQGEDFAVDDSRGGPLEKVAAGKCCGVALL